MAWHQKSFTEPVVPGLFQIPKKLQETRRYPALSKGLKAKVFCLNAAKLFKLDVEAKRKDVPKDNLSHIKMAYLNENPSPSYNSYGGGGGGMCVIIYKVIN